MYLKNLKKIVLKTAQLLPLIFMAVLIFGCQSNNDSDDDLNPEVASAPKPSAAQFNAALNPTEVPNKYQVVLSWGSNPSARGWIISRAEEGEDDALAVQLSTLDKSTKSFIDNKVEPGKTYRYLLTLIDSAQYTPLHKVSVAVPKDLEVKGTLNSKEISGINRLFLNADSKIQVPPEGMVISVNELVSNNGVIETFPDGQTAPALTRGLSAGNVTIRAQTGRGILHIISRGERGGKGAKGGSGGPGNKGPSGSNGECGYHGEKHVCEDTERNIYENMKREAAGSGQLAEIFRAHLGRFYCKNETANGGLGQMGAQGGKGGTGSQGGDTGSIYVRIELPSEIQIKPQVLPGRGGAGGEGGIGGPGGPGGDPGRPDHLDLCKGASPGPVGPQGPTGPEGDTGAEGMTKPVCVRVGMFKGFDCDKFPEQP